MWLNFSDPIINNLESSNYSEEWVVIPEEYPADSWIYLLVTGNVTQNSTTNRLLIPAAHPVDYSPSPIRHAKLPC